jgi:hypothetical protein
MYHMVKHTSLEDLCFVNLSLRLTKRNVFEIFYYARVYHMKDLLLQCMDMIALHIEELKETKEFQSLGKGIRDRIECTDNPTYHEELILSESESDGEGDDLDDGDISDNEENVAAEEEEIHE